MAALDWCYGILHCLLSCHAGLWTVPDGLFLFAQVGRAPGSRAWMPGMCRREGSLAAEAAGEARKLCVTIYHTSHSLPGPARNFRYRVTVQHCLTCIRSTRRASSTLFVVCLYGKTLSCELLEVMNPVYFQVTWWRVEHPGPSALPVSSVFRAISSTRYRFGASNFLHILFILVA